jgi:hypothetical protein
MLKPPLPANEKDRVRTLQLYKVLDTGAEKTLDDLTRLAASICETPIALISLVDEKRQWFKSKVGIDAAETPRDIAFCAHAILDDKVFVVEDASHDSRFADNPLVTEDPNIRFYAGAPLKVADGNAIGTLCVIDRKPRHLSGDQHKALETLRHAVVTQLELRRALDDFQSVQKMLRMCAWCRNVQDAKGAWHPLQDYVQSVETVTHGMCPACVAATKDEWSI